MFYKRQGFSKVFFLFPSPPQKRVKERVAALALPRQSGNTLFYNLGWGACCQSERFLRSSDLGNNSQTLTLFLCLLPLQANHAIMHNGISEQEVDFFR